MLSSDSSSYFSICRSIKSKNDTELVILLEGYIYSLITTTFNDMMYFVYRQCFVCTGIAIQCPQDYSWVLLVQITGLVINVSYLFYPSSVKERPIS